MGFFDSFKSNMEEANRRMRVQEEMKKTALEADKRRPSIKDLDFKMIDPSAADDPSIILCDGSTDASLLIDACSQQTMLVVHRMWECKELWQAIAADQRTFTTFDLFYCGIAFFRQRHDKHQYIVNF